MQVPELELSKEQAKEELRALKKAIKKEYLDKRNAMVRDMLKVYGHFKHGGKIIDIYEAFKKAGLKKKSALPRIAIVVATAKMCYLYKRPRGAGIFSDHRKTRSWDIRAVKTRGDIEFPSNTFKWRFVEGRTEGSSMYAYAEPHNVKTVAPIIPAKILASPQVRAKLSNYHIIFEVETWEKARLRPPRDPILVKMLTPNLAGILGTWDLTPLERAIIRGRLVT